MNAALEPEAGGTRRDAQEGSPMRELTRPPKTETKLRRRTGPLPGTAFATEWTLEQAAGTVGSSPDAPAVVVVGFDGSEPAQRALNAVCLQVLTGTGDAGSHPPREEWRRLAEALGKGRALR
jgi:hypothetical protein